MKFYIYRDYKREWRWRLFASNGNIIADSGEGYTRKANCKRTIASIRKRAASARISEYPE